MTGRSTFFAAAAIAALVAGAGAASAQGFGGSFYLKGFGGATWPSGEENELQFLGGGTDIDVKLDYDTGYVLGVARNVLREHLRKLAKGRDVDPEVESMASLAPGPTSVIGNRREHRLLLEGLRRLPVEHQIALELFYWEGLNANQIADLVGISHSAMRSRMTRARALLREAMAEIAESQELLASTVGGLEGWVAQLRERLGN